MDERRGRSASAAALVAAAALAMASPRAGAVDLVVAEIAVTQAIQHGSTPLVARNVTFVRARIEVNEPTAVAGVDGLLRVIVEGDEAAFSPVHSINGPIVARPDPQEAAIDDWLNFLFVPPLSQDVVLRVEVNPLGVVPETRLDNNTLTLAALPFECRGVADIAYVPIDYTFQGGGLPDATLIEPGIGDGFVRAIYRAGDWNYYLCPLPTFTWSQDVNATSVELLLALQDIRVNQLPGAGHPQPHFVYGWLPGNPYVGGGRAIGIPGDAAFGNTETIRHQRTFAHELGHLLGLSHNAAHTLEVGIDTEHHLADTEGLGQAFAPTLWDVMVAGQLTSGAYVYEGTYLTALADDRLQCGAAAARAAPAPLLRVCGSFDRTARSARLDPIMLIERGTATVSRSDGDLSIQAGSADGRVLAEVRWRTDLGAEPCAEHDADQAPVKSVPFHVLVPAAVGGSDVAAIRLVDATSGEVIVERTRSPAAPEIAFESIASVEEGASGAADAHLSGRVRVEWRGEDRDGEELTYNLLYTFDGGQSWLPVVLGRRDTTFEFDVAQVPASLGRNGRLRLVASDGMNNAMIESAPLALGRPSPPEVHLFTPNQGTVHALAAPIALHGSAWDREDSMLDGEQVTWSSSRDGVLGHGRLLVVDSLSVGAHTITMQAFDLTGQASTDTVAIEIVPRDVFDGDVDDDGMIDVADLVAAIVAWGECPRGGPPACPADVTGDGRVDVQDLVEIVSGWG